MLQEISKILGKLTTSICCGVGLQYSFRWYNEHSLKCFKELCLRHFWGDFPKRTNQEFFQTSPEKYIK